MGETILKGSTNVSVYFRIVEDVGGTSPGEPKTGLTHTDLTSAYYVRTQGLATNITPLSTLAAANSAHADGGFKEVDGTNMPGLYRFDVPDAVVATAASRAIVQLNVAGASNAVAEPLEIELVDYNPEDATRLGLTALPNANADAAGGLPVSDAGGLDLDTLNTNVSAILSDTGTDGVVLAANAVSATAIAANAITAAKIADGAIDAATFAAGAIDAAAIAANAIGASELATDAVNEIRDAILSDSTPFAGANINAAITTRATPAEVNAEVDTALADVNLDHLVGTATGIPAVPAGTFLDQIMDDGTEAFDRTTDSLQAIRDRGDTAWITGGGGGITDILNLQPIVPFSIDLADTATVRLGLMLTNAVDDLPSTAEITPGTISIERKAIGGTSWSAVVTDAACLEQAGLIYYDEVFDTGTGYAEGDSIRITFKSQKITVAANDYDITDANGVMWQTSIRQTMRGTDSASTHTAVNVRTEMDANSTQLAAIETRLPAALVGGRMDSDVEAINNNTEAAVDLSFSARTIVRGSAIAGTLSTTQMTTDLTEATDDHYNGRVIIWTSGVLKDQATDITDYTGVTKLLTFTAVTEAPSATDTFVIV